MQRTKIDKDKWGRGLYGSPKEGGRLNRSLIYYHFGIPDLDEYLKDKNFTDLDAEFGIDIYNEVVLFYLYRGEKAVWIFPIDRGSITEVKATHGQNLNIRKDLKVSGGVLGAIGYMGIVGGIVAGTIDALTSGKDVPKDQLVLGSIFEIFIKTENNELEKIIVSTTDKYKETIEQYLKYIFEPKQDEKKGCFIATVCYGDVNAPQVEKFRQYRDTRLNKTFLGKIFIKLYYLVSPSIAKHLKGKHKTNNFIRVYLLDKFYNSIR